LRNTSAIPAARGFTLIEVGMALVLLSGLLAIAIPSINAVTAAELKKTTSIIQGTIRDTYARTALSGEAHRIVFDLEANAYWVERAEGGVVMKREKLTLDNEGNAVLDKVDERVEDALDSDDAEDQEKVRLYSGPTWQPVEDRLGEPQKLHPDVAFKSVWADHLEERAFGGQVGLHFFPGGYMQEAQIIVSDAEDADDVFAIVTEPLTGETFVERDEPRLPSF